MAKTVAEKFSDAHIKKLFRNRCVGCKMLGNEVHELIPRSRSKEAITMPQNRVLLCTRCHRITHDGGYTIEKETALRMKAERMLENYGVNLEEW
jgi:5-methylcytosine-specific restriction endonuclease McrA